MEIQRPRMLLVLQSVIGILLCLQGLTVATTRVPTAFPYHHCISEAAIISIGKITEIIPCNHQKEYNHCEIHVLWKNTFRGTSPKTQTIKYRWLDFERFSVLNPNARHYEIEKAHSKSLHSTPPEHTNSHHLFLLNQAREIIVAIELPNLWADIAEGHIKNKPNAKLILAQHVIDRTKEEREIIVQYELPKQDRPRFLEQESIPQRDLELVPIDQEPSKAEQNNQALRTLVTQSLKNEPSPKWRVSSYLCLVDFQNRTQPKLLKTLQIPASLNSSRAIFIPALKVKKE